MSAVTVSNYNPPPQDYSLISMLKNIILDAENQCIDILGELKLKAVNNNLNKEELEIKEKEKQIKESFSYFRQEIGYEIQIFDKYDFKNVEKRINGIVKNLFQFADNLDKKMDTKIEELAHSKAIEEAFKQIEESLEKEEENAAEVPSKSPLPVLTYTEDDLIKISEIKNIPLAKLKTYPKESIKNLIEETNLILNKEKEEKRNTALYKSYINTFVHIINDKNFKNQIKKIIEKDLISKEEFEKIKEEALNIIEKESKKRQEEKVKEEIINQLLIQGYVVEDEHSQILYIDTEDKNYKVMMKIKDGKITSKFVKLVDKKDYKPSEYERIKDKEKMKKWCSDFDKLKEKLKEKGIIINDLRSVYELEENINYVYSQEVKKLKKEKGAKNAVGKRT